MAAVVVLAVAIQGTAVGRGDFVIDSVLIAAVWFVESSEWVDKKSQIIESSFERRMGVDTKSWLVWRTTRLVYEDATRRSRRNPPKNYDGPVDSPWCVPIWSSGSSVCKVCGCHITWMSMVKERVGATLVKTRLIGLKK